MTTQSLSTLTSVLHTLTGADNQNDIVKSLQSLATLLNEPNASLTATDLFNALLGNVANAPSGDAEEQFNSMARQILSVFDMDGDGAVTGDDLTWFKSHKFDAISGASMKMIMVISKLDSKMFKVKLTSKNLVEISYNTIMYALFLPLVTQNHGFRTFIENKDGCELLAEILNFTHSTLASTPAITETADAVIELFKTKKCFSCCTSSTVKTNTIEETKASANILLTDAATHASTLVQTQVEIKPSEPTTD